MGERKKLVFQEAPPKDPLFEELLPSLNSHLALSVQQNKLIEGDFEKAIAYYREHGFSDDTKCRAMAPMA